MRRSVATPPVSLLRPVSLPIAENLKLAELLESAAGPAGTGDWWAVGDGVRAVERERAGAGPAADGAVAAGGGIELGQAYEVEVRAVKLVARAV